MKPSVFVLLVLSSCLWQSHTQETEVVTLAPEQTVNTTETKQEEDSEWGIGSIRDSFEAVNGYFDSFLELLGGRNGVCQYRCRYGLCGSSKLVSCTVSGPQNETDVLILCDLEQVTGPACDPIGKPKFDLGIPAMTKCCNQLDLCYDTCGANKYRCDAKFRWCLYGICSDLKKSLGFVSKVETCETIADTMFNTVWTLGCKPFMNSQRAACICNEEEKDEL